MMRHLWTFLLNVFFLAIVVTILARMETIGTSAELRRTGTIIVASLGLLYSVLRLQYFQQAKTIVEIAKIQDRIFLRIRKLLNDEEAAEMDRQISDAGKRYDLLDTSVLINACFLSFTFIACLISIFRNI